MSAFRSSAAPDSRDAFRQQCLEDLALIPTRRWRAHASRLARVHAGRFLLLGALGLGAFWRPDTPMSAGWILALLFAAVLIHASTCVFARNWFETRALAAADPARGVLPSRTLWHATDRLEVASRLTPLLAGASLVVLATPWLFAQLNWDSFTWSRGDMWIRDYSAWWLAPALLLAQGPLLALAWRRARRERGTVGVPAGDLVHGARMASLAIAGCMCGLAAVLVIQPDFRSITDAIGYDREWLYLLPVAAALLTGVPHLVLLERWLARAAAEERAAFLEPEPEVSLEVDGVASRRRTRIWGGAAACAGAAAVAVACAVTGGDGHGAYRWLTMVVLAVAVITGMVSTMPAVASGRARVDRLAHASVAWPLAGGALLLPALLGAPLGREVFDRSMDDAARMAVLGLAVPELVLLLACLVPRPATSMVAGLRAWALAVAAVYFWSDAFFRVDAQTVATIAGVAMTPQVLLCGWLGRQLRREQGLLDGVTAAESSPPRSTSTLAT